MADAPLPPTMTKIPPSQAAVGIGIMALAMLIAPFMDLFAKLATAHVVPGEVAMGRFLTQTVILLPIVVLAGEWGPLRRAHVFAGLCSAVAILSINSALAVMPIANAIAIFFVEPLLLTLLSALILRERLGWRRLSAVTIGLVGAMVVLRPNLATYGWSAVLPLITAISFAGYMIVLRVMSPGGGRIRTQFWIGAVATATLAIVMLGGTAAEVSTFTLTVPPAEAVWLIVAAGALACVVHQMIAQAMARAEAGALAPLQYLEIVAATGIGWIVFADFPDAFTLIGTVIIVGAGVYVFRRERQLEGTAG